MKTTIKLVFAGAITGALMVMGACSDDEKSLPKIDGYNNSDEVLADNLLAHWTFDDTKAEEISGATPSNEYGTATTYVDGQIGKGIKLTKSVLKYPVLANISNANALNSFSVSLWVNVAGSKKTAEPAFTSFFGLIPEGVTDIWPDISANAETSRHLPSSDTLELKNSLNTHPVEGGNSLQDNVATINTGTTPPDGGTGKYFLGARRWAHYVMVWNPSTHKFFIYADGEDVGAYTTRGTTGNMIMATPVRPVFGSLASSDIGFAGAPAQQGWNPFATASIDDVRVFNTAMTQADARALYNLGKAGR